MPERDDRAAAAAHPASGAPTPGRARRRRHRPCRQRSHPPSARRCQAPAAPVRAAALGCRPAATGWRHRPARPSAVPRPAETAAPPAPAAGPRPRGRPCPRPAVHPTARPAPGRHRHRCSGPTPRAGAARPCHAPTAAAQAGRLGWAGIAAAPAPRPQAPARLALVPARQAAAQRQRTVAQQAAWQRARGPRRAPPTRRPIRPPGPPTGANGDLAWLQLKPMAAHRITCIAQAACNHCKAPARHEDPSQGPRPPQPLRALAPCSEGGHGLPVQQNPGRLAALGVLFSRVHTVRTRTFDKLIATTAERRSAASPCLSHSRFARPDPVWPRGSSALARHPDHGCRRGRPACPVEAPGAVDARGPLSALAFKLTADDQGPMVFVRACTGTLHQDALESLRRSASESSIGCLIGGEKSTGISPFSYSGEATDCAAGWLPAIAWRACLRR